MSSFVLFSILRNLFYLITLSFRRCLSFWWRRGESNSDEPSFPFLRKIRVTVAAQRLHGFLIFGLFSPVQEKPSNCEAWYLPNIYHALRHTETFRVL